jgi:hypothetical protein
MSKPRAWIPNHQDCPEIPVKRLSGGTTSLESTSNRRRIDVAISAYLFDPDVGPASVFAGITPVRGSVCHRYLVE